MVRTLASKKIVRPVYFQTVRKYDETPLKCSVRWRHKTLKETQCGDAAGDDDDDDDDDEAELEPSAKVVVVEHSWCMGLMACTSGGSEQALVLRGSFAPQMRVCSSMTAEALKSILVDCCTLPADPAEVFSVCTQVAVTDEHSSNIKAERMWRQDSKRVHAVAPPDAGPGAPATAPTSFLHILCDVHKTAAIAKKAFDLDGDLISNCLHLALVARSCGGMARMRCACKQFFHERLVFTNTGQDAGLEAEAFRENVFSVFLSGSDARSRRLRTALRTLLNGNYGVRGEVQHFCTGLTCCRPRKDCLNKLRKYVVKGLFGRGIKVFPPIELVRRRCHT